MSLVLASACAHALWTALLKRARNLHTASVGVLGVSVLATGAMLPWIRVPAFPQPAALVWGLAAGVGEGCYFLALSQALRTAPLAWSYSWMRAVGMLLVWPVSILWLGERLHPLAALSVAVVCAGLGVMGLVGSPGRGFKDFFWAGVTGILIGSYTLCYKAALADGANPVALYGLAMLVALPVQIGIRIHRQGFKAGTLLPSQWGLVWLVGLLCTASFLLYLEALAMEGAGAMATLRNTSIVFAVLLSRILGERPTPRQWLGAALVSAGAMGLAWPQ
jgi:drug/metabolite transporter (DMT)-like permease